MERTSRIVYAPRWLTLLTGLAFYSSVGALFLLPHPWLRLVVFACLLLLWPFASAPPALLIGASVITGGIEWFSGADKWAAILIGAGWGSVSGATIIALRLYPRIFCGSDWAALARVFGERQGPNIALLAFFVYRALPELELRLKRIARAMRTYGHRQYREANFLPVLLAVDGLTSYFLEVVDLLLASQRIAERRQGILFAAAGVSRPIHDRRVLVGQWLVVLLVCGGFILSRSLARPL